MHHKPLPDWNTLTFSFTETDCMYRADGDAQRDPIWAPGRIEPYGPVACRRPPPSCPTAWGSSRG